MPHPTIVTVVLDWGTTSFRAYLVDEQARVLDTHESENGVQHVPKGEHAAVLSRAVQVWREKYGKLDIVAAGMIGSRNGWKEMPYAPAPATVADIAAASETIRLPDGDTITFIPGLMDPAAYPYPDVMRGEETQLIGFGLADEMTVVLPGTHSKWARVGEGRIERFRTFVTGEVFATLSNHSFLAKAANASADHTSAAFAEGVALAFADSEKAGGLLTRLFAVRTGWLAGKVDTKEIRSRLSGLIVGWEFAEAHTGGWFEKGEVISVVGDDDLVAVYEKVAQLCGLGLRPAPADAAIRGALAVAAIARTTSSQHD
ncbi:2-dehydro-3-deoxygalactonokinase [Aminobacter lissarensis]|uniref:2-dehydro-3-deoxygalactonokinase n=1 Tax=Aminobacter carboxidus TaxID=376165 RepID=A0A8E2BEJ1_9HYPH|nr:2-dehydro-3-deoxygalactonokinase [Aminobacter lissarensis]MBB6469821.1 2-dehydro-3-deoxygalactonokinase [Aminobacter lissarensis]